MTGVQRREEDFVGSRASRNAMAMVSVHRNCCKNLLGVLGGVCDWEGRGLGPE